MKNLIKIISLIVISTMFIACEVEDPFVDRIKSPVLVSLVGSNGIPTTGLALDPTISSPYGETATFSIGVFELDKTNILDHTKGIDSIPVTSLSLSVKYREGNEITNVTTNGSGIAMVQLPWSAFGVSAKGGSVLLSASGSYKNVPFTKFFRLASN
jgi:hypothetical protein